MDAVQHFLKCVLLGATGVGKSTFCKRNNRNQFESKYYPTVIERIHHVLYSTDHKDSILFAIWEVGGRSKGTCTTTTVCRCGLSERRHFYYQGAKCGIVMFDLTSKHSFKQVLFWVRDLRTVCGLDIPIVLLGNKSDLSSREVKDSQIERLCRDLNMKYFEVSVKDNINIDNPFIYLTRELIGDIQILRDFPLFASS